MAKYHLDLHGNHVLCSMWIRCRAEDVAVDSRGRREHFRGSENEALLWAQSKSVSDADMNPSCASVRVVDMFTASNVIESGASAVEMYSAPSPYSHGDFVRSVDGRLFVHAHTDVGSDLYPMGDLSTDENLLRELHEQDPQKMYQNGECWELAHELYWNHEDIVDIEEIVYPFELLKGHVSDESVHVIAKHKDGYYVDSLGAWSEEGLLSYWRSIEEGAKLYREDVEVQSEKTSPSSTAQVVLRYLDRR